MGLLQNEATGPKTMQISTFYGCRGGVSPSAGNGNVALRILTINFRILQQTYFAFLERQAQRGITSFKYEGKQITRRKFKFESYFFSA